MVSIGDFHYNLGRNRDWEADNLVDLFEDSRKKHTKRKHRIIEKYLKAWLNIWLSRTKHLFYVDCFAGTGKYGEDGEEGSPLIAYRVLEEGLKELDKVKATLLFFEKNRTCFEKLKANLSPYMGNPKVEIELRNCDYQEAIDDILKEVAGEAAFFLIDPCGFKDIPFETIQKFLKKRWDVCITFMYEFMNRFKKVDYVERYIREVLDLDENERIPESEAEFVEKYLSLFARKGFPAVAFRNKREGKEVAIYYLVFATSNATALKIMWDVMSKEGFSLSLFAENSAEEVASKIASMVLKRGTLRKRTALALFLMNMKPEGVAGKANRLFKKAMTKCGLEFKKFDGEEYLIPKVTADLQNCADDEGWYEKHREVIDKFELSIPVHFKEYKLLNGNTAKLVEKVGDGYIIKRFDRTPFPVEEKDVVCPHFLELKWAYGCPFDCAWCYLKGTFRNRKEGIRPQEKNRNVVLNHLMSFLREKDSPPEILNTGEIADSLMSGYLNPPFLKVLLEIFSSQDKHKVLLVTKGTKIENLLEFKNPKNVIVSFSVNAVPVAERWEHKAPPVPERIEAARKLYEHGYPVRVRIDPMVPIEGWEKAYQELVEMIFDNFTPERITLGSLRGLQSTINAVKDKSWVAYLSENSGWGKKIAFGTRLAMYDEMINLFEKKGFLEYALCKETLAVWDMLGLDWKGIKCNCTW